MGRNRDDLQVLLRWGEDVVGVRRFDGSQIAGRGLWTSDLGLTELRDARPVWRAGDLALAEGRSVSLAVAPPAMDGSELVADLGLLPAFDGAQGRSRLAAPLGLAFAVAVHAVVAVLWFSRAERVKLEAAAPPAARATLHQAAAHAADEDEPPEFFPRREIATGPARVVEPGTRRAGVQHAGGRPRMSRPAGPRAIGGYGGSSPTRPFDPPTQVGSGAEGGTQRRAYMIEEERRPIAEY